MKQLNEKAFQDSLISFFKNLGYDHKTDDDLFEENLRQTREDFLLKLILSKTLKNINSQKTDEQIEKAIFEIEKINNKDLILGNKKFNNFFFKIVFHLAQASLKSTMLPLFFFFFLSIFY